MANPALRWRNMCHFVVARYEQDLSKRITDDLETYVGDQVLLTGHHRFLAALCVDPA